SVALTLVLLVGSFFVGRRATPPAAVEHAPVSVLIADFDNKTNDAAFQSSLEQALGIGIEGASFITTYSRTTAQQLASTIQPGAKLNESVARLVAGREGIKVILAGAIEPKGSGYGVTVRAVDPANGNTLATAAASATSQQELLKGIGS